MTSTKHARKWWRRFRDAVTGRFTDEEDAVARPERTVGERRRVVRKGHEDGSEARFEGNRAEYVAEPDAVRAKKSDG